MAVYGHSIVLAETFVDHSCFHGTCYRAAGWLPLGQTLGFGRNAGRYYYHGKSKTIYVYPLNKKARQWLKASFLAPELSGGEVPMVNLNETNLDKPDGLIYRLKQMKDPRKRRGVRHNVTTTIAIAICAVLSGCRSFVAIGEWASDLSQDLLARLGCRYHDEKRKYIAPSEPTIRRHLQSADAEEMDRITSEWLAAQADPDAISVDGKTLRGSKGENGKPVHLMAAVLHKEGVVIAQKPVDEKSNEITAFRPLLEPLTLEGKVVTADAMHTQVEHARFLVEDKKADYLFVVKGNQGNLKEAIESLDDEDFSP